MKRNWLQTATLILCAVLLAVTLWQGQKISELQTQAVSLDRRVIETAQNTRMAIQDLSSQMAEGEKQVQDWELAPTGMDKGTNSLLTEFSLNLKEWRADTEVRLTARQGSDMNIVYLGSTGTGRFSGALPVSLAGESLSLEVRIDGGGTSRQEELGGWEDISMLLPLRIIGSGYGGPTYRNGVFSVDDYSVNLSGPDYTLATAKEPAFFLQCNGETVWEGAGVPRMDAWAASGLSVEEAREAGLAVEGSYSTGGTVEAECQSGDTVALFFTCRDEYGLKYTFPLESWKIDPSWMTPSHSGTASGGGSNGPAANPVLSWD